MSKPLRTPGNSIFQPLLAGVCLLVVVSVDVSIGYHYLPLQPITTKLNPVESYFRNHVSLDEKTDQRINARTTPSSRHLFSYYYYKNFNQPEATTHNYDPSEDNKLARASEHLENSMNYSNNELTNKGTFEVKDLHSGEQNSLGRLDRMVNLLSNDTTNSKSFSLNNRTVGKVSTTGVAPIKSHYKNSFTFGNLIKTIIGEEMLQRMLYLMLPEPGE